MDGDRIAGNDAEQTEVGMNRSAFAARLRSLTRAVASPRLEPTLLVITAAALTAGGAAWLAGDEALADLMWVWAPCPRWHRRWAGCSPLSVTAVRGST